MVDGIPRDRLFPTAASGPVAPPGGRADRAQQASAPEASAPIASGYGAHSRTLGQADAEVVLSGLGQQLERLGALLAASGGGARAASLLKTIEGQLDALAQGPLAASPGSLYALNESLHVLLGARVGQPRDPALDPRIGAVAERVAALVSPALLAEVGATNPGGHSAVDRLLALCASVPVAARFAAQFGASPSDLALGDAARLERLFGPTGVKLLGELELAGLSRAEVQGFARAMSEVRRAAEVGAAMGDDFQRTNWIHTLNELPNTLAAARALKLPREELLAAMIGSLASDAFKDASVFSVLWHNRPGGELVVPLLIGRHFAGEPGRAAALATMARRVALEHQITPPMFMAGPMGRLLGDAPAKAEIVAHVGKPLAAPVAQGEIRFSPEAQATLEAHGLPGWAVPVKGTPHYRASLAAIAGDVAQYVNPDGVLKIAIDLRYPEHPVALFRDPLLSKAVASSTGFSFGQGMSVLDDPDLVASGQRAAERMQRLLEGQVYPEVERRLRAALQVPPGAPTPPIPYWNQPVQVEWPAGTPPEAQHLGLEERQSVQLVRRTFEDVLARLGNVELDPFGHRARSAS